MSAIQFEAFLARIYVDDDARAAFLSNPRGEALKAGLNADDAEALATIDRIGLELFAQSLQRKRRPQVARHKSLDRRGASIRRWIDLINKWTHAVKKL
jgi:hypothetical protein